MGGEDRAVRNADIIQRYADGESASSIGSSYGVSRRMVQYIVRGNVRGQEPEEPLMPVVFVADIIAAAARVFGTTARCIKSDDRSARLTAPRYVVCYLAREMAGRSYPLIGRALGGRDHSTIIHGYRRCIEMMARDERYAAKVELVREAALIDDPFKFELPEPEPEYEPEPISEQATVNDGPDWWELDDDEYISRRIAVFQASGGSFVEVRA